MRTFHSVLLLAPLRHLPLVSYGVLFVGTLFEGEAVVYTAAFLVHREILNIFIAAAVAYSGAILGDFAWYRLGTRIRQHPSPWGHKILNLTDKFDIVLHEKTSRTIFISKFSYGIHHLLMARAGYIGVPEKLFFKKDIVVSAGWLLIVGSLGYLSSAGLSRLGTHLKYIEIGIAIGLIFFFVILGSLRLILRSLMARYKEGK